MDITKSGKIYLPSRIKKPSEYKTLSVTASMTVVIESTTPFVIDPYIWDLRTDWPFKNGSHFSFMRLSRYFLVKQPM